MVQWHRFVQPVLQGGDGQQVQSSVTLRDGSVTVACGGDDMLVGISANAAHVSIRLNGETHRYERALVKHVSVNSGGGNREVELADQQFDMLVVAHGGGGEATPRDGAGECLHASRALRSRRPLDDFGLV